MGVNGIWKIEMLGPYGWESTATAFLKEGKILAGSQDHYTVGSYEVSGNKIKIDAKGVVFGKVRTLFGDKKEEINLNFEGEVNGDEFAGLTSDESSKYTIAFRAIRLADLP
jgi:hypothetical protein